MKRSVWLLALLLAPVLACGAAAQTLSISTTPSGSFTNSAGAAMAKVISEKTKLRAIIQAQQQQGHIPVNAGSADFGMANGFDLTFYLTGTGEYEGQGPKKNIRMIGSLLPYRVAIHVRADSPMKTLADLKGKRIGGGFNAQKTIGRIIEAHLANVGLSYKDVVPVLTPNVGSAAADFTAGKSDAFFFATGSAAVKQAAVTVGGLRVLPIDASPEAVKRMQEILPGSYIVEVQPAPQLDGITAPTKLVAFDMVFFTQPGMAEPVVYEVTKVLHQSKAELAATFPAFNLFNPANMAKPVKDAEFHPGAIRYYREAGLMPKS
jgi:hypothetical protein